jgi:hypothetical protein
LDSIASPKSLKLTGAIARAAIAAALLILCGCAAGQEQSGAAPAAAAPAASAPSAAASGETANAPDIHEGDVWMDRLNGSEKQFKVEAIKADGSVSVSEWGNQIVTDKNWNILSYRSLSEESAPATNYSKPLTLFPFPLTPGKTWKEEVKWQVPDLSLPGKTEVAGKLGNWEDVTVPAGTFHAIHGEVSNRVIGREGAHDQISISYWYAPKVNRFVKYHYESNTEGTYDAELVSYKPASH